MSNPFENPDTVGKLDGRFAAAKLDVKEDRLVGNPPAKVDARLEGKPEDNPGMKLVGKDVCGPGLDVGGKGNLGMAGPPGIPGPPVSGGRPAVSNCPTAAAACGGTPGILGNLNPGGINGVIPAIGLFTFGGGRPFFSASSIF